MKIEKKTSQMEQSEEDFKDTLLAGPLWSGKGHCGTGGVKKRCYLPSSGHAHQSTVYNPQLTFPEQEAK